jgi:hypothetical protein
MIIQLKFFCLDLVRIKTTTKLKKSQSIFDVILTKQKTQGIKYQIFIFFVLFFCCFVLKMDALILIRTDNTFQV